MKAPVDIIAIILTITISVILIAVIIKDWMKGDVDQPVVGQVVLALIAIISLYVGNKLKNRY